MECLHILVYLLLLIFCLVRSFQLGLLFVGEKFPRGCRVVLVIFLVCIEV